MYEVHLNVGEKSEKNCPTIPGPSLGKDKIEYQWTIKRVMPFIHEDVPELKDRINCVSSRIIMEQMKLKRQHQYRNIGIYLKARTTCFLGIVWNQFWYKNLQFVLSFTSWALLRYNNREYIVLGMISKNWLYISNI